MNEKKILSIQDIAKKIAIETGIPEHKVFNACDIELPGNSDATNSEEARVEYNDVFNKYQTAKDSSLKHELEFKLAYAADVFNSFLLKEIKSIVNDINLGLNSKIIRVKEIYKKIHSNTKAEKYAICTLKNLYELTLT